jgi:hypothetical protein
MPLILLPVRALGYLWYLIKKDDPKESPCVGFIPKEKQLDGLPPSSKTSQDF